MAAAATAMRGIRRRSCVSGTRKPRRCSSTDSAPTLTMAAMAVAKRRADVLQRHHEREFSARFSADRGHADLDRRRGVAAREERRRQHFHQHERRQAERVGRQRTATTNAPPGR